MLVKPGDETPCLVIDEADARIAIEMTGEIAKAPIDEVDDALVDFDAGHLALVEHQRRKHVSAAAGSDNDDA